MLSEHFRSSSPKNKTALDASALVIPLTGFLPVTDPRVQSTTEKVRERLTSNGLVYRYLDG